MTTEGFKRKLTAVMSADVAGYSRLMSEDEAETVKILNTYKEIMSTLIKQHRGRVVDSPGDNVLAEFGSVVDAVQCAVSVQNEFQARNAELPEDRRMEFRIGINLGDVIEEEDRIYGDGVNIAARLEALANPGGICVSKTAFDHIESKLPLGYEYLGEQTVKNIPKPVGAYRVLMEPRVTVAEELQEEKPAPVRRKPILAGVVAIGVLAVAVGIWYFFMRPTQPRIEAASEEKMTFPLPDRPSIAVLPFDNLSGDPKKDYIADGISENIISALSKIRSLLVIARNSTFTYKGKPVKIKQVSEELGIRYVLEGSVQMSGERLRISAQLIDALKGDHIWAETYDRDLTDLFTIMDEITLAIAKGLSVELVTTHVGIAGTKDLEAWTLCMKGYHHLEQFTKEDNAKARDLLERAIELDPNFVGAWTGLAWAHQHAARYGYGPSRTESLKQATRLALKSLEIEDSLSTTHSLLGDIYILKRQYDEGITEIKKAVDLNPNDAWAHYYLGKALFWIGEPDKAIPLLKKAMRFNPFYPWFFPLILGRVYYHSGQYEDAMAMIEEVFEICKEGGCSLKWPYLYFSMIYSELGQYEEARSYMQKVLEYDPRFNIEGRRKQSLFKDQARTEREMAALLKAGAPEHPPSK